MIDDIERQLIEAERPEPPATMRARVLAATLPLVCAGANRLDRIWFSRAWRTAGAMVFVALVVTDMLSGSPAPRVAPPGRAALETAQAVETAARDAGLPAAQASALAAQALAIASRPAAAPLNVDALLQGSTR
jgi:hypothetical protein